VTSSRYSRLLWPTIALALLVSTANSVQARVNGQASEYLGQPVVAAMMSVGGGFVLAATVVAFTPGARRALVGLIASRGRPELHPWHFLAGFGGGIFIFGQALVVPLVGVSVYIIAVVTGQTIASLAVDRYGLGPAGRQPVTVFRWLAALLAIVGVVISGVGRGDVATVAWAAIAYGLAAGAATAVQYALNGRIAAQSGSAMVTSALNFFMGFILLSVLLVATGLVGVWPMVLPPSPLDAPLLWLGGPLGLLFIASAAILVKRLGVLAFAVVSVLGQLVGAVVLDLVLPTQGTVLGPVVFLGLVVTVIAVIAATVNKKPGSASGG
jgi:transporter family-2 protein